MNIWIQGLERRNIPSHVHIWPDCWNSDCLGQLQWLSQQLLQVKPNKKLLELGLWADSFWTQMCRFFILTSKLFLCLSLRDVFWISLLNSGTSFTAGFVVFSVLGFMAHQLGVRVDVVAESGADLIWLWGSLSITEQLHIAGPALIVIHLLRSRSGLHCLPTGYSYDASASVLDRLLLLDAHHAHCGHTCKAVFVAEAVKIISSGHILNFFFCFQWSVHRGWGLHHLSQRPFPRDTSCTCEAWDFCPHDLFNWLLCAFIVSNSG